MQKLIFSLLLAAISTGVFWQVKDAGLVWDDPATFAADASANQSWSKIWQPDPDALYVPATTSTQKLADVISDGSTAKTMHTLSILLHTISAILLFLILHLVLHNHPASFFGALLFALHPLQVEPVAYASALGFVLGGTLSLFAVWQYLQYAVAREHHTRGKSNPLRHYYVATVSFVLATLAVPAFVVTPLVASVFERLLPRRSTFMAPRQPIWPLAVWGVLAVPAAAWAMVVQNTDSLSTQLPWWSKPVVAADALSFYISKLVAPILIGPDFGRSPTYLIQHWWGFVTWILPAALVLLLLYWRGKSRAWYGAAFMLFLIGLAPFLGLVHFEAQSYSTVASRYAYLALLGPALAMAYTVSMPKRSWLPVACVAAVAACGYLSRKATNDWQSDDLLWKHAVTVNPGSPIAHKTLGDNYRRAGDWQKAKVHYEKVLEVNATSADIHFYLAEIERSKGDPKRAADLYTKTLELDPNFAQAHNGLGLVALAAEDYELSLAEFSKAAAMMPEAEEPQRNLGMLYVRKKSYNDAVPILTKALELATRDQSPHKATVHALLGLALANTNQNDRAQTELEAALALDPTNQEAHRTLADIYFARDEFPKALPHYEQAVKDAAAGPEVHNNLGIILAMNKDYGRAVSHFNRSIELKPNFADAHNNLGMANFYLRKFKEATDELNKALELNPSLADPHYFLGDIARWQGREQDALNAYYRALKANPGHIDANYRLGNYFMKEENAKQAIRHYQAALRVSPEDQRLKYSLKKAEQALEQSM